VPLRGRDPQGDDSRVRDDSKVHLLCKAHALRDRKAKFLLNATASASQEEIVASWDITDIPRAMFSDVPQREVLYDVYTYNAGVVDGRR
jgi:hypothetical protein